MLKQKIKIKRWILLISPAFAVVVFFFGGGLFFAALESFGYYSFDGGSLTFDNFRRIAGDREIISAVSFTLIVTFISTIISLFAGTLLAVRLRQKMRQSAILKTLLQIPLAVPHLAVALILLNILAPSGIFARFFYLFGVIGSPSDFPVLTSDADGIGIILAYAVKETPFVALMVLTVLARTGDEFELAAQNLGASKWQQFRFVTLPMIAPAAVFSSLIVWVFIFGAFEIPLILGRVYPAMLAIAVQRKFNGTDLNERPEAMALAVLMTFVSAIFVWLYLKFTKKFVEIDKTSFF